MDQSQGLWVILPRASTWNGCCVGNLLAAGLIKGGTSAPWLVVGGAIYLTGVFGVTAIGNAPMNKRLDAMAPDDTETDAHWAVYLRKWTRLNHVRTVSSIVAAGAFLVATGYL